MAEDSKDYKFSQMILCEGPEDVCFFSTLISERGLPNFHVAHTAEGRNDAGGNSRFGSKLRALRVSQSFRRNVKKVLVVTDSDEDQAASFARVCAQLIAVGLPAPAQIGEIAQGAPAICVLTMPRVGTGNLECCLMEAASATHPQTTAFVEQFVNAVANGPEWTDAKKGKLTLRALMAARWYRDPGIGLVRMFKDNAARRIIPLEHQSFNPLVAFLREFAEQP